MLNLFGVLEKWISSYFSVANLDPCRFTHLAQTICISKFRQFPSVLSPYAGIHTSSTNPRGACPELYVITDVEHVCVVKEVVSTAMPHLVSLISLGSRTD